MAFEYNWFKSFGARELELIYLFDYAIIVETIVAERTNSYARGLSAGSILLVPSRAKAIAIHIINSECIDPTAEAHATCFNSTLISLSVCACNVRPGRSLHYSLLGAKWNLKVGTR
jgi:hypothetical protein